MYDIEKGIPVPPDARNKYPFDALNVGDSFLVPVGNFNTLRAAAYFKGKRSGKKYVARLTDKGIRVWRTL